MLHYVSDDTGYDDLKPWVVKRSSYLRLLDYLHENGYSTIGFKELTIGNVDSKRNNIIITFDDCPKHLWDFAIPELQKRGMKAVFYMPTKHLGGVNQWNVDEGLSEMSLMDENDIVRLNDIGMEVGSHAHGHVMLEDLDASEVGYQLTHSKSVLEQLIKEPVLSIAYPYGSLPCNTVRQAHDAGYEYGLGVYAKRETRYSIRRWYLTDEHDKHDIARMLSYNYRVFRSVADKFNYYSKRIMQRLYRSYQSIKKGIVQKAVISLGIEGIYGELIEVCTNVEIICAV